MARSAVFKVTAALNILVSHLGVVLLFCASRGAIARGQQYMKYFFLAQRATTAHNPRESLFYCLYVLRHSLACLKFEFRDE